MPVLRGMNAISSRYLRRGNQAEARRRVVDCTGLRVCSILRDSRRESVERYSSRKERRSAHHEGLRPRRPPWRSPMRASPFRLLHGVGAPGWTTFRGSRTCPRLPLSTLRRQPRGRLRMTRGRRGWLGLQRAELASAAGFAGARRMFDASPSPSANALRCNSLRRLVARAKTAGKSAFRRGSS